MFLSLYPPEFSGSSYYSRWLLLFLVAFFLRCSSNQNRSFSIIYIYIFFASDSFSFFLTMERLYRGYVYRLEDCLVFFFVEQIIMVDVTVNFVNFGYSFLFLVELILGLNRIGWGCRRKGVLMIFWCLRCERIWEVKSLS